MEQEDVFRLIDSEHRDLIVVGERWGLGSGRVGRLQKSEVCTVSLTQVHNVIDIAFIRQFQIHSEVFFCYVFKRWFAVFNFYSVQIDRELDTVLQTFVFNEILQMKGVNST